MEAELRFEPSSVAKRKRNSRREECLGSTGVRFTAFRSSQQRSS